MAMDHYHIATRSFMSEPVETVRPDTPLAEVNARLAALNISSLVVVNENDVPLGVISRTDLLRVGRRRAGDTLKGPLLDFADAPVSGVMTDRVVCVEPDDSITVAAQGMLDHGFHRVFVTERDKVVGVISTRDLMAAIVSRRDETMVAQHMSSEIVRVEAKDSLLRATELLETAHVGGVIVVEDGYPVGMFTQVEALRAADIARAVPVEEVMDMSFVCVPAGQRMHRAAKKSLQLQTRRVIVVNKDVAVGILTGLDFARCVVPPS